jgi:hypothetical protein
MDKLNIDLAKQGCQKGDEYNAGLGKMYPKATNQLGKPPNGNKSTNRNRTKT